MAPPWGVHPDGPRSPHRPVPLDELAHPAERESTRPPYRQHLVITPSTPIGKLKNMTVSAFRALHHGRAANDPLVLPTPWDAASAQVFADAGYPALATPSMGIAASLGYEDGSTPPDEMFTAV